MPSLRSQMLLALLLLVVECSVAPTPAPPPSPPSPPGNGVDVQESIAEEGELLQTQDGRWVKAEAHGLYEQETSLYDDLLQEDAAVGTLKKGSLEKPKKHKHKLRGHTSNSEDTLVQTTADASGRRRSSFSSSRRRSSFSSGRRRSYYGGGRRRYGHHGVVVIHGRRRRRYYYGGHGGYVAGCFPSSAKVQSQAHGGKMISIEKIAVGDHVMTHTGYSKVLFFATRKPAEHARYLKMTTSNSTIVLTPSHAVFTSDGTPILAANVRVGDTVMTAGVVEKIEPHQGVGLFAPITATGALVVDGITTSDYGPLAEWAGQHRAHTALTPLRLLHWAFPTWKMWHAHQDDGIHPFMKWGMWLFRM